MGLLDLLRGPQTPDRKASGTSVSSVPSEQLRQVTAIMLTGNRRVDAVGESYYQDALRRCCGVSSWTDVRYDCEAVLVLEPENPYDSMAVAVYAGGEKVAHLSRADARTWHPVLEVADGGGCTLGCRAVIAGHGPGPGTATPNLGIFLHLPELHTALEQVCAELGLDARKYYV